MFLLKKASKKIVIFAGVTAITFVVLVTGILAAHSKIKQLISYIDSGNITDNVKVYPVPIPKDDMNQSVLPNDAAKSGELAIIVDNLDSAKDNVAQVADKNGGNVYSTFISYASNSVKNGSMVIKVPVDNFDSAFSQLKAVGKQLVQESTRQIPQNNIYPQPMASGSAVSATSSAVSSDSAAAVSAAMPAYFPAIQDKGYIKVIFADYSRNVTIGGAINNGAKNAANNVASKVTSAGNRMNLANMMGFGYTGQNMRNNTWLVLAIKSILLIVLIVILTIVGKKISQDLRRIRRNRQGSHTVRQMTKTRARVIRIKKK